jgi:hypothetical protein
MKQLTRRLLDRTTALAVRLVLLTALLALSAAAVLGAESAADPRFERLKSLVGTWTGTAEHGESKFPTEVTYRLTGGGTAVMEILFEGTEHEMSTLDHRDGPDVMLTHYCAAGNQPRMKAVAGDDPAVIHFEFAGGTNMDAAKDMHMHNAVIRWLGPDHIQSAWTSYQGGEAAGDAKFDLTRKK